MNKDALPMRFYCVTQTRKETNHSIQMIDQTFNYFPSQGHFHFVNLTGVHVQLESLKKVV